MYPGIYFDDDLKWQSNSDSVYEKLKQRFCAFFLSFVISNLVQPRKIIIIIIILIKPVLHTILSYGVILLLKSR